MSRIVTFGRLEAVSFTHSCIYAALIVCAVTLGSASRATYALGWAHGLLWIGMSLVCIAAARARIIPFWLAVTVAVLEASDRSRERSDSWSKAAAGGGKKAR